MMDRIGTPNTSSPRLDDVSSDPVTDRAANAVDRRVRPHSSRAVRLLQQLICQEVASAERLAMDLSVSSQELEEYRTGCSRLPLHTQRRLAELVLDSAPGLAREARRLQLQCRAAEAYHAKETETHMVAPPARFR